MIISSAPHPLRGDSRLNTDVLARHRAPTFLLGRELRGTTLGIIGLGRIGRAVAERAIGFGMTITYHNRQSTIDLILRFRTC